MSEFRQFTDRDNRQVTLNTDQITAVTHYSDELVEVLTPSGDKIYLKGSYDEIVKYMVEDPHSF